jgi:hypothetical protein
MMHPLWRLLAEMRRRLNRRFYFVDGAMYERW